jgi:hypothetical protein
MAWDLLTSSTALLIFDLDPDTSPLAQFQISLPISKSGVGIARAMITAVTGYLGNQAINAPAVQSLLPHTAHERRGTALVKELKLVYDQLEEFGVNLAETQIKATPANFYHFFAQNKAIKVQQQLTRAVHEAQLGRLLKRLPRKHSERLKHHSGPGKGAFLTVARTCQEYGHTPPKRFESSCEIDWASHIAGMPEVCGLCNYRISDHVHYIDCAGTRSLERLYLHNQIVRWLEAACRAGGGQSNTEPRFRR